MKGKSFIVLAVLFLCAWPVYAVIEFNDGGTHNIDYGIDDKVRVDYQAPEMYTTVNVLDGGGADEISGYENSRINVSGGSMGGLLTYGSSQAEASSGLIGCVETYDSSQLAISGGSTTVVIYLHVADSSRVDISGGNVENLSVNDYSLVNISGGYILDDLYLYDQSQIKIFGYDFTVDGQPVNYGELFAGQGHLTGTLLSGDLIDNDFYIGRDAKIILIPEPTTVFLLGIGGLFLKRRRS